MWVALLPRARAAGKEGGEKIQCIEASDHGQDLRDSSSFRLARQAFARCARDTCPEPLRRECVEWLVDLDTQYPSVIIAGRDDRGKDLEAVRVLVDGIAALTKLDGKPLPVDPGLHHFRYETDGFAPLEEDVIVRTGEKDRPLNEVFRPIVAPAPPPFVLTPELASSESKPRVLGWTLAGVGALGFASEAFFGITGASERSSALAAGGCAPHCSATETQDIETKFIVADISLGVGVVSTALALYFLIRPEAKPRVTAATVDVQPREGGLVATLGGTFQ
jgi:hypothetical protein